MRWKRWAKSLDKQKLSEQPVNSFPPDFEPPVAPTIRFNNTKRVLHESTTVLMAHPCCDDDVVFANEPNEAGEQTIYRVSMEMFKDFGSPTHITLSLKPGDQLNEEH